MWLVLNVFHLSYIISIPSMFPIDNFSLFLQQIESWSKLLGNINTQIFWQHWGSIESHVFLCCYTCKVMIIQCYKFTNITNSSSFISCINFMRNPIFISLYKNHMNFVLWLIWIIFVCIQYLKYSNIMSHYFEWHMWIFMFNT
jgi:hypothetical protein